MQASMGYQWLVCELLHHTHIFASKIMYIKLESEQAEQVNK